MPTVSLNYAGASGTAMTCTLTSLANDAWRESTVVDNTTNLYVDALVGGSVQTGTTPTANTTIDIYAYGQWDASGDYTAGISGTDGVYTADGEEFLLKRIGTIIVDATSDQDYEWGPVSVATAFGGIMPQRWGLVFHNNTAATLNATGTNNDLKYTGVKYTVA